jgi:hypothetical protein
MLTRAHIFLAFATAAFAGAIAFFIGANRIQFGFGLGASLLGAAVVLLVLAWRSAKTPSPPSDSAVGPMFDLGTSGNVLLEDNEVRGRLIRAQQSGDVIGRRNKEIR